MPKHSQLTGENLVSGVFSHMIFLCYSTATWNSSVLPDAESEWRADEEPRVGY